MDKGTAEPVCGYCGTPIPQELAGLVGMQTISGKTANGPIFSGTLAAYALVCPKCNRITFVTNPDTARELLRNTVK